MYRKNPDIFFTKISVQIGPFPSTVIRLGYSSITVFSDISVENCVPKH